MTKHYEYKSPLRRRTKQSQSNPNKANFTIDFERGIGDVSLTKSSKISFGGVFSSRLAGETVTKWRKCLFLAKNSGIM